MGGKFPETFTKITYVDGEPTTITLRRVRLDLRVDDKVKTHTFDQDVVHIGGTADNDLILEDETVSRNHCQIYVEGEHYLVRDLGSTNGTFINDVRIKDAWLEPDCLLRLGNTELRFNATSEKLRVTPSDKTQFGDLIGGDAKMREVYTILEKIAPTDATVVIGGETGTGKEVVARTIHGQSRRATGPFMVFDCGAVPENLIESELFGHEKGSFTGAVSQRRGVFEMADGGTVFLDELGELALELQPKLLRVLEQREVKRVGGNKSIKVNVRVVAATNRNLEEEVRAGRFREDLFYRLSVVRVGMPPLRDRKDDVPMLVMHFLRNGHFNRDRDGGRRVTQLSRMALDQLLAYDWPGNVRELSNVVERAVSFAESDTIQVADLPSHLIKQHLSVERSYPDILPIASSKTVPDAPIVPDSFAKFKDSKEKWVSSFERDYIEQLLRRNGNNISHAAREADIDRKYFRKLMKKYGITAN